MSSHQMSVSRFRRFMDCPAAAVAYYHKEYKDEPTQAMLLGQYYSVALLTPDLEPQWLEANAEHVFSKRAAKGEPAMLKAWIDARELVAEARRDAAFMAAIEGVPEAPIEFDLEGVRWLALPDKVQPETRTLIDLKRAAMDRDYDERLRRYVAYYDGALGTSYWFQLAIYRMAYKARYGEFPVNVALAVLYGSNPVGREIITFDREQRFEAEIICAAALQRDFVAMLDGSKPVRVGPVNYDIESDEITYATVCRCAYCRKSRMIETVATSAI
jgi:hypothetical protein